MRTNAGPGRPGSPRWGLFQRSPAAAVQRGIRPPARAGAGLALLLGSLLLLAGCDASTDAVTAAPPRIAPVTSASPTAAFRHDPGAFTQGLLVHAGALYESTGGQGNSTLRRVDPRTGEVLQRIEVPNPYFAEGIAVLGDRLYQLTWRNNTGFVYDVETLERIGTFRYEGEGWGLTTDGESLIRSDGTDQLRFHEPDGFQPTRTISVRDGPYAIHYLNELEWVRGEIWANVWQRDDIARIDPADGRVIGWLDLERIVPEVRYRNGEAVANGIAYDPELGAIYLTGKLWPELYQVPLPPELTGGDETAVEELEASAASTR